MPAKYLRPVDLDDETTAEDVAAAEITADETEPESDWIFGPATRRQVIDEPRIQGESTPETEPFRVGQLSTNFWGPFTLEYLRESKLDLKDYRMALPRPQWPEPGAVATTEVAAECNREHEIYFSANSRLKDLLVFLMFNPDSDVPEWSQEAIQRAGENLKFLQGLWTARNLTIPSREQLVEMARQTKLAPEEIPAKPAHYLKYFEGQSTRAPEMETSAE
jgi:hypothetical protein